MDKLTIPHFQVMKNQAEKITMMTAYDYPTAALVDQAEIEMILVGDSLAMTIQGLTNTVAVTMEQMLYHTQAVQRAVRRALVVGDMPFLSYQVSLTEAIHNAGRFLKEAGADCVKLEGGGPVIGTVKALTAAGIPVMGHLGLTPQTASQLGGYKVQGRSEAAAQRIIEDAVQLEKAGAFAVVLECIPQGLAQQITGLLQIPTIGIGAGRFCDGQVLVYHDVVGLFERFRPKFVKQYLQLNQEIKKALELYRQEVKTGVFPDEEHSFL